MNIIFDKTAGLAISKAAKVTMDKAKIAGGKGLRFGAAVAKDRILHGLNNPQQDSSEFEKIAAHPLELQGRLLRPNGQSHVSLLPATGQISL